MALFCSCCDNRLLASDGNCGCSAQSCVTCTLCVVHCSCGKPPAGFTYDWNGLEKCIDPGGVRTNMTYDPGEPQADEPIVVPKQG